MKRALWISALSAGLSLVLLSCARPKSDEPLLDATIRGDVSAIERLITNGLHPDHQYNDRATALAYAARHGELAAARVLIERGADVNASHHGFPVLVVAAASGNSGIVRALLEKGADANAKTDHGFTALMAAAANSGDVEIVRQLLANGADVHARTSDGRTALSFSKGYARQEVRDLLKRAGATE